MMKRGIIISSILMFYTLAYGQKNDNSILSKGIKYTYDDQSSVSFHIGTQVWARYTEVNPGTRNVEGEAIDHAFDFALRRSRFSMYASFLNDKYVVYTQLGMNGQTFVSSTKPQLYFHDIWSAFKMFDGKLYAGMGLHGWEGLSRISSVSYNKNIMLDHPGFSLPDLGKTDQSGRKMGAFIKGNIARFNYRYSVNSPFVKDEISNIALHRSTYVKNSNLTHQGYVFYSFLDKEVFKSSYLGMSYLGSKKILNLGAGFDYTKDAMASINDQNDTVFHAKALFGADVFLDYPFADKSVFTFYLAAYLFDFGPNYVRTYSVMNNYTSGSLAQGGGNTYFNTGTGNIIYSLVGYILPESLQPFSGMFQPVCAIQYKDFEGLGSSATQFDIGLNYYISGFNAKLNIQYSNWKLYNGNPGYQSNASIFDTRGMVVFQVQMYL